MIQSCLNSGLVVYQVFFFQRIHQQWCFCRLRPVMEKLLHSKSLSPAFYMFSGKVLTCVFLFHCQKNIQICCVPTKMLLVDRKKYPPTEKKTSEISFFSGGAFAGLGHSPVFFRCFSLVKSCCFFLVHKHLWKLTAGTSKINRFNLQKEQRFYMEQSWRFGSDDFT